MRGKWWILVLIVLGAVILILASGLGSYIPERKITGFKIAGLLMLMFGLYKVSRPNKSTSKTKKEQYHDKDRG